MAWFLKFLQVLSINEVAELIFDANDQLNNIEGVKTVVSEGRVEGNRSFARGAEVILRDGNNVLLDLVVTLEDESVLGCIDLRLIKFHSSGTLRILSASDNGVMIETDILQVAHSLGWSEHGWGSAHEHGIASLLESSKS